MLAIKSLSGPHIFYICSKDKSSGTNVSRLLTRRKYSLFSQTENLASVKWIFSQGFIFAEEKEKIIVFVGNFTE
jgi:hypothetical protein